MKKIEVHHGIFVIKIVHNDEDEYPNRWYLYINEHGIEKHRKVVSQKLNSDQLERYLEKWLAKH